MSNLEIEYIPYCANVLGQNQLCHFSQVLITIHIYFFLLLLGHKQKIQEIKKKINLKKNGFFKQKSLFSVTSWTFSHTCFTMSLLSVYTTTV